MNSTRYRIVCHGVLADGFDAQTVQDNLVTLFKLTDTQAGLILSGRSTVLKRGLDGATAERFTARLARAGLQSHILPETDSGEHAQGDSSSVPGLSESRVLAPENTHPSIRFTPVNCPSLSEKDGVLDTGRADTGTIPYNDLALAMVWAEESPNGQAYRLVLFAADRRRPFEAADTATRFHSFPGVASTTAREGYRRLVEYLRKQHPNMYIDEHTASFLDGNLPLIAEERPLAYITALGTALLAYGVICDE